MKQPSHRTRRYFALLSRMKLNAALFVLFIGLSVAGTVVLRGTLLQNAHESNTALSRYYASETNSNLTTYTALLDFGTRAIEARVYSNGSWDSLEDWAASYCDRLRGVLGDDSLDVYGVIDGRILSVGAWRDIPGYDVTRRTWYRDAMAARGQVVFTDVYQDALTGKNIVTVAKACKDIDAVLAFDLYPENFSFQFADQDLPDDTSFFLCDSAGTVLYQQTSLPDSAPVRSYLSSLVDQINAGTLDAADASVTDLDGRQRAVNYTRLGNGWYAIVTTPYEVILGQLTGVYALFAGLGVVFALVMAVLTVRDWRRSKTMERTNETVRVLGNSYYAIYLVNYHDNTYEMIKGSDYVRARIPKRGPYGDLLRTAGEVIEEDTFKEFEESFSAANIKQLVAQRVRDYGGDFLRKFGEAYRWVNVRVLYDESLAPEEVVLCFREVDQEKQRQLQERHLLEEALDTARDSLESKQAFFNNMSHDMRTPLNAIIGLTDLARRRADDPAKVADCLRRIEQAGKQLLALINDILDISRMEHGMVSVTPERMDLPQQIRDAAAPFQLQAEREGKPFSLRINVRDPLVMGDPMRFGQVLNNLLSNALKYSRPGDQVRLEVEQLAGVVSQGYAGRVMSYRITVADTGIGMAPEFLDHIFELYAREQRFGTKQAVGTGLGMPITKNLVTQMGGDIQVESQVDQGSTFTVTIPFPVLDEKAAGPDEVAQGEKSPSALNAAVTLQDEGDTPGTAKESGAQRAAQGEKNAPAAREAADADAHPRFSATPQVAAAAPSEQELLARLEGKRILLAEDNEINQEIAVEMLGLMGMQVTSAWNGREAVDAFAAAEPGSIAAVLMDMQMPVMDGCDAARAIRELGRPDAQMVPIVAVTANAFAEDIVATTVAGMNAHVSKPIDFTLLCRTLADLIGEPGDAVAADAATDASGAGDNPGAGGAGDGA